MLLVAVIWIGHGLLVPPLIETIFDYRKIRMVMLDQHQSTNGQFGGGLNSIYGTEIKNYNGNG